MIRGSVASFQGPSEFQPEFYSAVWRSEKDSVSFIVDFSEHSPMELKVILKGLQGRVLGAEDLIEPDGKVSRTDIRTTVLRRKCKVIFSAMRKASGFVQENGAGVVAM